MTNDTKKRVSRTKAEPEKAPFIQIAVVRKECSK
jgi:hypothetical protein